MLRFFVGNSGKSFGLVVLARRGRRLQLPLGPRVLVEVLRQQLPALGCSRHLACSTYSG
jgi:hypothetical protein